MDWEELNSPAPLRFGLVASAYLYGTGLFQHNYHVLSLVHRVTGAQEAPRVEQGVLVELS